MIDKTEGPPSLITVPAAKTTAVAVFMITIFLGAFLLWYLTVGPVRGFAFFLGVFDKIRIHVFADVFFTLKRFFQVFILPGERASAEWP